MGIYFLLEERRDDTPLREIVCKHPLGEWRYFVPDGGKFDFKSFYTKDDYDVKILYRVMAFLMHDRNLERLDLNLIEKEDVSLDFHPGWQRPIDIDKWIDKANSIPEGELKDWDKEMAINTLMEFKNNPNLYWFISY